MSIQVLQSIRKAIGNLSPEEIRRHTERPFRLVLYADREAEFRHMEDFFAPSRLSPAKRNEVGERIYRASEAFSPA